MERVPWKLSGVLPKDDWRYIYGIALKIILDIPEDRLKYPLGLSGVV